LSKAQQDRALRVSQAYFQVLLAEEALRVLLAQQLAMTTQLDAARMALSVGQGTRTQVDDAQVRLDINQAREIGARQQIDHCLHALAILTNRPVQEVLPLNARGLELRPVDPNALATWIERAEKASPDLRSLGAEFEANRLEVERVKAGHKPTLDQMVQPSHNMSDNLTTPDARYNNNQTGIQDSLPHPAGAEFDAQLRAALVRLNESQERMEAARHKLDTEVRKQFQAVTEGIAMVRAMEQAERFADRAVLSSQKAFQAGTRTRLDILNAEQQRSQTRMELAKERINYLLARLQLLALSGDLNLEEITAVNRWLAPSP